MEANRGYDLGLQHVLEIREMVAPVHPFLARVFPIAIVENDHWLIFEADPSVGRFVPVQRAPTPMPIPAGVRAAFPLECLGGRPACVVSADAFDSPSGYAAIFHEFVHCHQLASCELELKKRLRIARDADSRGDYMWELNYPFRYSDPRFAGLYRSFLKALQRCDGKSIWRYRE